MVRSVADRTFQPCEVSVYSVELDAAAAAAAKDLGGPFAVHESAEASVFADWLLLRQKALAVMTFLREKFVGATPELLEHHGQSVRIRIPKLGQEHLAALFRVLHNDRAAFGIWAVNSEY